MNTEDLVQSVVQEVLKRLQKEDKKACVLVLAERDAALQQKILSLVAPYYEGSVDVVFSGECCGGRAPERVILPELSCSGMADLAAGKAGSPRLLDVLRMLLNGQRVEVLDFEYRRYAGTAPDALYRLYTSYEKVLRGFGLVAFQEKRPETAKTHASLITASMVEQAAGDGVHCLDIPSKSIVTPLAAETADALGISIRKQG